MIDARRLAHCTLFTPTYITGTETTTGMIEALATGT
jgi:hypothetical protein